MINELYLFNVNAIFVELFFNFTMDYLANKEIVITTQEGVNDLTLKKSKALFN